MQKLVLSLALGAGAALAVGACGTSSPNTFTDTPDTGVVTTPDGAVVNPTDSSSTFNTDTGPKQQPDVYQPPVAVVYAHSPTDLFQVDPNTKAVTKIGAFQGCTQVIDIALDQNSKAWVTTNGGALYTVDLKTAACTEIAKGTYPNSLSFVPAGTLDPSVEALVGYEGANYVRIDPASGAKTTIAANTLTSGYVSSGDIVSVKGGGTFLTVKGGGCGDCLLQVDPKTGAMLKNFGSVNHQAVFGLAYWAATLYGFDSAGKVFTIDAQQKPLKTVDLTIPNAPANLQWWGAGSTTSAPVADQDGGTIPIN